MQCRKNYANNKESKWHVELRTLSKGYRDSNLDFKEHRDANLDFKGYRDSNLDFKEHRDQHSSFFI